MQIISNELYNKIFGSLHEDVSDSTNFDFEELLASTKTSGGSDSFNYRYDKTTYVDSMVDYCKEHKDLFTYIAKGSSRITFLMKDGRCLKIAINEAGISQNQQEYENMTSKFDGDYECFPKLFEADTLNYRALIEEFGTKITHQWFKRHFGCFIYDIFEMLERLLVVDKYRNKNNIEDSTEDIFKKVLAGEIPNELVDMLGNKGAWFDYDNGKPHLLNGTVKEYTKLYERIFGSGKDEASKSIASLYEFWRDNGEDALLNDDLEEMGNWAICHRNGHDVPVVIDAGFSNHVYVKHYH